MTSLDSPQGISARRVLSIIFGSVLLLTMGTTIWLLTSSGNAIVDDVVRQAATSSQATVKKQVEHFLEAGDSANKHLTLAFSSSRVDVDSPMALQRLLRDIAQVTETGTVSNIFIGLRDGRLHGLSAVPSTWPTPLWVHTESSPRTEDKLTFFSDLNNGEAGPAIMAFGRYDPRVRPWYIAAVDSKHSVWSDVYPSFVDGVPTITRSVQLLASDGSVIGVAGTDLFISHLQHFLATLKLSDNSEVFILNARGEPIAAWGPAAEVSSPGKPAGISIDRLRFMQPALDKIDSVRDVDKPDEQQPVQQRENGRWLAAYGFDEPGSPSAAMPSASTQDKIITGATSLDGEEGFLTVVTLANENSPPWLIGVFVPSSDYLQSVTGHINRVVPLGALLILFSLAAIAGFAALVSRPLERLCHSVGLITRGQFNAPVAIPVGREVGLLAREFDNMRESLSVSFSTLESEKQKATATLQSIEDGVIVIDDSDNVVLVNRAAERLIGSAEQDAINSPVSTVLIARDARSGESLSSTALHAELASSRHDGLEIILEPDVGVELNARLTVTEWNTGADAHGAVLTLHDLTLAKQLRAELTWAASHDALTELFNRRELVARIARAIDKAREQRMPSALAFFDLVDFSRVNNEVGHGGGDELLRQIAARFHIVASGHASVTVSRIGGDEFVVLVEGSNVSSARDLFESMRDDITRYQFTWIDRGFTVAVSVGATQLTGETLGAAAALRDAGSACMKAKEEGSFRVHLYDSNSDMSATMDLDRSRINEAMTEGRFELMAQKVVSLKAETLPDIELLLRLREADGQLQSPDSFLPAVERLGMASRLDRHVIELAFTALVQSSPLQRGINFFAINLSGQTLGDPTFLPWILDAFTRFPIDPKALVFEVTETATVTHLSVAKRLMNTLGERGVRFSLDDFGTGMCSFAYLKELPINGLKIDGSFVMDMTREWRSEALVRSMVELAKSLELKIVAECIENEETLDALKAMGVDSAQGYLLHRPEPF